MILTTKARYAVMSILEIAIIGSYSVPIGLSILSDRLNIPISYLEQIFLKLKNSGIVTSVRGPGGGYLLSSDAKNISLDKIIDAVEEDIDMTRCSSLKSSGCMPGAAKCKTHDLWEGLTVHIREYLAAISVEDLLVGNLGAKLGVKR